MGSLADLNAPQHILAGLEMLQFHNPSADRLAALSDSERVRFLGWCDARQLSLMLPHIWGSRPPAWLREAVFQRTTRYELRFKRLKRELFEIVEALNATGLEFVMLKGLSHAPALSPDARQRAQGDIDLWLRDSSVYKARDVLRGLGYVVLLDSKSRHLAPMVKRSNWEWQGDFFDPEMPISVELHYELWSESAEYITAPGIEQFWERKKLRDFDGYKINVLCDEDLLAFATLHLLLHLLHGELPLQRAWEIGRFLNEHITNDVFWNSWRNLHPVALRQLETPIFYLVTRWFECRSRRELEADFQALPAMVSSWFEKYSLAPVAREWAPNKLEIWLHLALITKRKEQLRVLFRRLIPTALPFFVNRARRQPSPRASLRMFYLRLRLLTTRLVRHLVTFFPTLLDGLRWFWLHKS